MLAGELGRDKRSPVYVFAYVGRASACLGREGESIASVNSINKRVDAHLPFETKPKVNLPVVGEFERCMAVQRLTLNPLEKRGYWRKNNVMNKQCQTSVIAKIEDKRSRICLTQELTCR